MSGRAQKTYALSARAERVRSKMPRIVGIGEFDWNSAFRSDEWQSIIIEAGFSGPRDSYVSSICPAGRSGESLLGLATRKVIQDIALDQAFFENGVEGRFRLVLDTEISRSQLTMKSFLEAFRRISQEKGWRTVCFFNRGGEHVNLRVLMKEPVREPTRFILALARRINKLIQES